MKEKITQQEYLQIIGLLVLADKANRELENIESAIASILNIPKEPYGGYGHISDTVFGERNGADDLLEKLKIEIEK